MESLKEQVNNLTNIDFSDDAAVADFFTEGHRMVVANLPSSSALTQSATSEITTGTFSAVNLSEDDILLVTRSNGTNAFQCRKIPIDSVYKYAASSGYYEEATATDPAWYIEDGALTVIPTPDSNGAKIKYRNYQSFAASGSNNYDITSATEVPNLPIKTRHIVILYVGIRVCERKLVEINSNLPSDLSVPVIETISTSLPTYTAPAGIIMPSVPADIDLSNVPSFPTFVAPSLPAEPDFTYISQVVETASDFTEMETALDDEDSELSGARGQKIQAKISEYSAKVNNAANVYREAVDEYSQKISRYGQQLGAETQRVQNETQKFTQEIGKATSQTNSDLSAFNAKISSETARFTNDLQKNRADFDTALQKYQAEIQKVSTSNSSNMAKFGNDLQNFNAKIQKQTALYQWVGQQLEILRTDFNEAMGAMGGGGASPAAAPPA
jgi:hypothetical protein